MRWGELAIKLGKRNWVALDLITPLSTHYKISKTEVKRIVEQGGLTVEFLDPKVKNEKQ